MKILYLHGLGSSGNSNTALALKEHGVDLLAPDYAPQHYQNSINTLITLIKYEKPERIIGTSMGGYYTLKLYEQFAIPSVVVNPCYNPAQLLTPLLDEPAWDYASDAPIYFDQAMLDEFVPVRSSNGKANLCVVIGRNDELIAAQGQREFCEQHRFRYIETDWGHRVEDVAKLLKVEFGYKN